MSFSHFGPVLEEKAQRGEKRSNGNWVFSQVLVHLFVFKTAKHPLLRAHLQTRKIKPNLIHSLLVSLSNSFGYSLLWSEATKFYLWFWSVRCRYPSTGEHGTGTGCHTVTAVHSFDTRICISISALL